LGGAVVAARLLRGGFFFFPLVLSPLFFSMIFLALVADEIGACYVEI
jgi:hypothetical protein